MSINALLFAHEVAENLRCSERFVLDEIRRKNLRATKVAGKWRVDAADLAVYLEAKANVSRVRRDAS
jgi:excisionase family DNA binding protein